MIFFLLLALLTPAAFAELDAFEWKADYYERDNRTNTLKGRGNAWFKQGKEQIWADEIEVNFTTNWAYATGNVHFNDGSNDIFCDRGSYALSGTEAVLEEATLISGQMVLSGGQIRKMSKERFEMDDGFYSNCNTVLIKDRSAAKCPFDWKIYGKHFKVTMEGYAHVYDAIIYTKELPMLYLPYYVAPAKSKRQSGILWLETENGREVGSALGLPLYLVLSPWHDLTITPTRYSKAGLHLSTQYTYAYSKTREGTVTLYGTQYKYREDDRESKSPGDRTSGLGEWAINIENRYSLWGRAQSRQQIRLVSDPYYPIDFPRAMGSHSSFSGLRSQVTVTVPDDNHLVTGQVTHFQSLTMPKDSGVDKGPVTQLPTLSYYRKTTPTPFRFLSFEIDTRFSNFYRPEASYDSLPIDRNSSLPPAGVSFNDRDYVREGQRLLVEPRAVLTFPIASGLQLQPVVKAGGLFYHFDVPSSTLAHQYYLDAEVPLQMYLAKNFTTGIGGLEKVRHIFSPRIIYAASLYRSDDPDHPFFRRFPLSPNPELFSNPRFDIYDQTSRFGYNRIELINRFFREVNGSRERFLTVTVANQYNWVTSDFDPRRKANLGPVEALINFGLPPFSMNLQAQYQLKKKEGTNTNESEWAGNVAYSFGADRLSIDGVYRVAAIEEQRKHEYTFGFYKTLPIFVDLTGSVTYNALTALENSFREYNVGFLFASKPVSCWSLAVLYTKNNVGETYTRLNFGLSFGGTFSFSSAQMSK